MMMKYGEMGGGDVHLFGTFFAVVVLADLVLLGIWLWKKIQQKS